MGGTDVENGNGRAGAPDDSEDDADELPPGLSAWFAIEEVVGETLSALESLGGETDHAVAFLTGLHRAVRVWLSWEMWAALLDAGQHTPNSLLHSVIDRGVDTRQLPRFAPATPPRTGQGHEWRAFGGG